MSQAKIIAVDLGGTNVRVAKVNEHHEIIEEVIEPSYAEEGIEKSLPHIKELIGQMKDDECIAIGMGVPGPINQKKGCMTMSTNLPGFVGYPIVQDLQEEFSLPVFVENDADLAGLAEAILGAGSNYSVVYYTTLSTGIGGGLIVNRDIVSGRNGFGGEVANVVVDRSAEKYNHLTAGAVENEASGRNITRKANLIKGKDVFQHAGDVFKAASEGDEQMQALVDEVTTDLALLYASISAIVAPDVFVLGGGMMKSKEQFLPQVIEKYKELVHEPLKDTPFMEAEIKEPGILGAYLYALQHVKKEK